MANAENDILGENPPAKSDDAPKIEVAKTDEPDSRPVPAADAVAELKRQLENEKIARAEAERRENAARQEAFRAKTDVEDTNLQLVTNAIETVKGSTAALKTAYSQAAAAQDWDRLADIQIALSTNAAKLLQLENGKEAMAGRPKPEAPRLDGVEEFASRLTPRSGAWVRSHPQFVTDQRLNQKMIAAHNLVTADGIEPDTDDYFSAVEKTLGLGRPRNETVEANEDDAGVQAAQVVQRRSSPPAAPVSRSGAPPGQNPRIVRLTAEEREIAALNKMTDEEYARAKLELKAQGRAN